MAMMERPNVGEVWHRLTGACASRTKDPHQDFEPYEVAYIREVLPSQGGGYVLYRKDDLQEPPTHRVALGRFLIQWRRGRPPTYQAPSPSYDAERARRCSLSSLHERRRGYRTLKSTSCPTSGRS